MINKVILATCDDKVKKILKNGLNKLPSDNILTPENEIELYELLSTIDEVVVIFDKYFLGYVTSYRLLRIHMINPKASCYVAEIGSGSIYLGVRLHSMRVNGFLSNIENAAKLKTQLSYVLNNLRTFPEEIIRTIEEKDSRIDPRCCSEVTEREMEIGMYAGFGKTQKEICYLTGISAQSVCIHLHRLKRKVGYKVPADLIILNKQTLRDCYKGDIVC